MNAQNQAFIKKVNTALVLRSFWLNPENTRTNIASELGLDKSTIVLIINRLLKKGIIKETEKTHSTPLGGRKAQQLALVNNYAAVLGLEIQPAYYKYVVLNLKGEILLKGTEKCHYSDNFTDLITNIITEMDNPLSKLNIPLLGISIGTPGWIDTNRFKILNSHLFHLDYYDFAKEILPQFDIPILIENDANCCAWGELLLFPNKRLKHFIYILGEFHEEKQIEGQCLIGIGMGIVADGAVYYGENYSAGEFKSVFWSNERISQFGMDDQMILDVKKNPQILHQIIEELLLNLSPITAIFNPEQIFIGGDLKEFQSEIKEILNGKFKDRFIGLSQNASKIIPSTLDEHDVAVGAAAMFLEKLFAVPQLNENPFQAAMNWDPIFQNIHTIKKTGKKSFSLLQKTC
ncbi:MAG: ROK family protein [Spirochaetes bacterium]|nr:ROK family protein [Spirochaetota bacterium]